MRVFNIQHRTSNAQLRSHSQGLERPLVPRAVRNDTSQPQTSLGVGRWMFGVLSSAFLAACTSTSPPESAPLPVPDTVIVIDSVLVEVESAANPDLEQQIARLQLELLERDALLEELDGRVDAAHQEVVRTMAKLQTQASRAEAASGIAEAEIAVGDLKAIVGGQGSPVVDEAQQFLDFSNAQFGEDNFAGALYLATQARAVAEGAGLQRGEVGRTMQPGEEMFAKAIPLQTLRRSNVRSGPGLGFEVLYTLDPGAVLVGRSHTDEWIHITDDRGRTGWVFLSLVEHRREP